MSRPAKGATTGVVYALRDPRDKAVRYVGQTTTNLSLRLSGHVTGGSRRVSAWVKELEACGLKPEIVPLHTGLPLAHLEIAEDEEIAKAVASGAYLLNEQSSLVRGKLLAAHAIADINWPLREAWRPVADAAIELFGGPMPPGKLHLMEIPNLTWDFISNVRPTYRADLLAATDSRVGSCLHDKEKRAKKCLWHCAGAAYSEFRMHSDDEAAAWMRDALDRAVEAAPLASRTDLARLCALIAWFMTAVRPWWHLANFAGVADDEKAFTAWAAKDPGTRSALNFLRRGGCSFRRLASRWDITRPGRDPGQFLAAVAAAYSGIDVPELARPIVSEALSRLARDEMATPPMLSLLGELEPDLATGGRSTTAVPDYTFWGGPVVLEARYVSGLLVRAELVIPDRKKPREYVRSVRRLWASDADAIERAATEAAESNEWALRLAEYNL